MKTPNETDLTLNDFVFLPDTFRIGADPNLTVMTGYLKPIQHLIESVMLRRSPEQKGEPTALIAAYDAEEPKLYLYCIGTDDTQCNIPLSVCEQIYLCTSMRQAARKYYQKTPEVLLNEIRSEANLPPLKNQIHKKID